MSVCHPCACTGAEGSLLGGSHVIRFSRNPFTTKLWLYRSLRNLVSLLLNDQDRPGRCAAGPPIHNMRLCSRPGEDPNAWKIRAYADLGNSVVPELVGRLAGEGFWDYREGGGGVGCPLAHAGLGP